MEKQKNRDTGFTLEYGLEKELIAENCRSMPMCYGSEHERQPQVLWPDIGL
jgi:hypothetical protein